MLSERPRLRNWRSQPTRSSPLAKFVTNASDLPDLTPSPPHHRPVVAEDRRGSFVLSLKRKRLNSETENSDGSGASKANLPGRTTSPYSIVAQNAEISEGSKARSPAASPNIQMAPLLLPSPALLGRITSSTTSEDGGQDSSRHSNEAFDPQLIGSSLSRATAAFPADNVSLRQDPLHTLDADGATHDQMTKRFESLSDNNASASGAPQHCPSSPSANDAEEVDKQPNNTIRERATVDIAQSLPKALNTGRQTQAFPSKPRKRLRTLKLSTETGAEKNPTWCDALEERVKQMTSPFENGKER